MTDETVAPEELAEELADDGEHPTDADTYDPPDELAADASDNEAAEDDDDDEEDA